MAVVSLSKTRRGAKRGVSGSAAVGDALVEVGFEVVEGLRELGGGWQGGMEERSSEPLRH